MPSPHTQQELAFRDTLATILNNMARHDWAELIRFAVYFHVDDEGDETPLFAVQLNERIVHAAQALQAEGVAWPSRFDDLATRLSARIPELQ